MPLTKLVFRPGINRETTAYANEGGWWDGNLVRFRASLPESIGGWEKFTLDQAQGVGRGLMSWESLDGTTYVALGTNLKYYVVEGGSLADITPIRDTENLSSDPLTTAAAGSGVVTVTDVSHGCVLNDFVTISGATAFDGLTTGQLNKEHQITSIINADSYTINTGGSATSGSVSGGGASVVATYQINTGLDTSVYGTGWGAGAFSRGTWGSAASTAAPGAQLRLWSQDNYGEDLLFCARDGGIYYWDKSSGTSTRAVALDSLVGAASTPTIATQILVSERDRHTIALGCDPEGDPGVQDPLIVRFSSQESLTDWESLPTNTAGELRIGTGSHIVCGVQTKQQVIIFTDTSVHAMQYIGPPYTFGLQEVSSSVSIMSFGAAIAVGDMVFWMGKNEFYVYDGGVTQIPCDVKEYVFSGINLSQALKVCSGHASSFSEVWWFYPSTDSEENDRYVIYNYEQRIWYYGSMSRTAWIDRGLIGYPLAVSPDGYIYFQEYGLNDGEQNPPTALNAYVESSVIDIGDGDQFMFATRLIPDVTFRNSTAGAPALTMSLMARNFPGDAYGSSNSNAITKTASVPVEQFTDQVFIRLRGRSLSLRVESNQTNTAWRLGAPRLDLRTDGRR